VLAVLLSGWLLEKANDLTRWSHFVGNKPHQSNVHTLKRHIYKKKGENKVFFSAFFQSKPFIISGRNRFMKDTLLNKSGRVLLLFSGFCMEDNAIIRWERGENPLFLNKTAP
jgi:hypothetical protein